MAYTTIPAVQDQDDNTPAWWNAYLRDNLAAMMPDVATTKGDLFAATGADAGARVAAGSDTQIVEADSGEAAGVVASWAFIPIGGIIMWNAALGGLPANWQVCDGTNGTPDLHNLFIVGAGGSYNPGNSGGATTINLEHDHTGTVGASAGGHTHSQGVTGAGASHTHTIVTSTPSASILVDGTTGIPPQYSGLSTHTHTVDTGAEAAHTHTNPDTAEGGAHTHAITVDNQLSSAQAILPPYYAIYYIMRLS